MRTLKAKLNNIFLSRSGNDFATPCELRIDNFEELGAAHTGNVAFAASGKAITTITTAKDIPFQINITKLYRDVYNQIIALAKSNIAAQAAILDISTVSFPVEIIAFNAADNLSFNAVFNPLQPFKRSEFRDDRNYEIVLNLIKV